MKRYLILDLDGTLIDSEGTLEKEILREFEVHKPEYVDAVKYIWKSANGMWYREFLEKIFTQKDDIDFMEQRIVALLEKHKEWFSFFPEAIETLHALSLNYILFLSTWSYTQFATQVLKKWWVEHLFAHIQWSETHSKSLKHIEIFKDITMDPDFETYALSVWDGPVEKNVALESGIDFIQIGIHGTHTHEIENIIHLPNYLRKFSNIDSLEIGEQNYIL